MTNKSGFLEIKSARMRGLHLVMHFDFIRLDLCFNALISGNNYDYIGKAVFRYICDHIFAGIRAFITHFHAINISIL